MRRVSASAFRRVAAVATMGAAQRTAVSSEVRDDISRVATKVKEEANGQSLDVAEMADATRVSLSTVKDCQQRFPDGGGDPKVTARLQTLAASLKAYHNRLNNLGSEAKSIHREAEALVKHVWGTSGPGLSASEKPQGGASTSSASSDDASVNAADFDADAPHVAKILEQKASPSAGSASAEEVVVERVTETNKKSSQSEEPVVEELEIEIESPEDDLPITTITQELYERGIDFADCHDAAALRKRYADMKAGKYDRQAPPQHQAQTRAPPPPERATQQQQQGGYHNPYQGSHPGYNSGTTTTETAPAFDPHPGAQRKMLDPMKAVWEVKQEIARENGVDANNIDLWSGTIKLEDHKRLYDYGAAIQSNPIQVRNKGDMPSYQ